MPSIRKTKSSTQSLRKAKKRLKRRLKEAIAEKERCGKLPACWHNIFLYEAAITDIKLLKQDLQQLKRKKR